VSAVAEPGAVVSAAGKLWCNLRTFRELLAPGYFPGVHEKLPQRADRQNPLPHRRARANQLLNLGKA